MRKLIWDQVDGCELSLFIMTDSVAVSQQVLGTDGASKSAELGGPEGNASESVPTGISDCEGSDLACSRVCYGKLKHLPPKFG